MARITAAQRKALPASEFALGKGHYPIDTANRARNALARGSQHASPEELATIKRKVHAKYPNIHQAGARTPEYGSGGAAAEHRGDHQAGAREDQDRKVIAGLLRQHFKGTPMVSKQAGARHGGDWADQRWFNMPSHSRTSIKLSNKEETREHQAGARTPQYGKGGVMLEQSREHQAGARMQGNAMHPRMHALSKASATHLLHMGHIDKTMHNKIHTASASALGAMQSPVGQFGSLAPPQMQPPSPQPMGGQMQAGARHGHKYPKYGAQHYMSTPAPTAPDEDQPAGPGGGGGGGGQAGARKRKW